MTPFGRCSEICAKSLLLATSAGFLLTDVGGITIQIDYTYDTGNYFSVGSAERDRLEEATAYFENMLEDDLDAITPTGTYSLFIPDSWQINFTNPSTGGNQTIDDVAIPADTIILYVGARSFGGGQLAEAGFGGYATFGGSSFNNTVLTRGESGITAGSSGDTDFAPWGGSLAVDTGTMWDTSVAGNGTDQHLYSTLIHEVAHVLGFGTAESWDTNINVSNEFIGTESVAEYGGNVPLYFSASTGRYDHLDQGLTSDIVGTMTSQEVSLDPDIVAGDVKLFTELDRAIMGDLGWELAPVPEPSQVSLLGLAAVLLFRRRR